MTDATSDPGSETRIVHRTALEDSLVIVDDELFESLGLASGNDSAVRGATGSGTASPEGTQRSGVGNRLL